MRRTTCIVRTGAAIARCKLHSAVSAVREISYSRRTSSGLFEYRILLKFCTHEDTESSVRSLWYFCSARVRKRCFSSFLPTPGRKRVERRKLDISGQYYYYLYQRDSGEFIVPCAIRLYEVRSPQRVRLVVWSQWFLIGIRIGVSET